MKHLLLTLLLKHSACQKSCLSGGFFPSLWHPLYYCDGGQMWVHMCSQPSSSAALTCRPFCCLLAFTGVLARGTDQGKPGRWAWVTWEGRVRKKLDLKGQKAGQGGQNSSGYIWKNVWGELGSRRQLPDIWDMESIQRNSIVWHECNSVL